MIISHEFNLYIFCKNECNKKRDHQNKNKQKHRTKLHMDYTFKS